MSAPSDAPASGNLSSLDVSTITAFVPHQLDGPELEAALVQALERIFTKEYILSDKYFMSRLDAECRAPLSVLCELPPVRLLTSDAAAVRAAVAASARLVFDDAAQLAHAAASITQRNTIILRDVPAGAAADAVLPLLGPHAEHVREMRADIEATIFITFSSEDVALQAFLHLRTQKLGDRPVQARIKTELFRPTSFYYGYVAPAGLNAAAEPFDSTAWGRAPKPRRDDRARFPRGGKAPRAAPRRGTPHPRALTAEPKGPRRNAPRPRKAERPAPRDAALPSGPTHFPPLGGARGKASSKYTKAQIAAVVAALPPQPSALAPLPDDVVSVLVSDTPAELDVTSPIDVDWIERRRVSGARRASVREGEPVWPKMPVAVKSPPAPKPAARPAKKDSDRPEKGRQEKERAGRGDKERPEREPRAQRVSRARRPEREERRGDDAPSWADRARSAAPPTPAPKGDDSK